MVLAADKTAPAWLVRTFRAPALAEVVPSPSRRVRLLFQLLRFPREDRRYCFSQPPWQRWLRASALSLAVSGTTDKSISSAPVPRLAPWPGSQKIHFA